MDQINNYYKEYYKKHGESAYLGKNQEQLSRMLTFKKWLNSTVKEGSKVLDIGCGDGVFAKMMPEYKWTLLDINLEKVDPATGNLVEADIQKDPYPFEDKSFDAIVCSEVLEHLWTPEIVHKNVKRLLKKEGVYLLSTPNFDWVTNILEYHRRLIYDKHKPWVREHINQFNLDSHQTMLKEFGLYVEKFVGADAHYCTIFANTAKAIQDNLKLKGVEIPIGEIHAWIGQGNPLIQHTIIMQIRKA